MTEHASDDAQRPPDASKPPHTSANEPQPGATTSDARGRGRGVRRRLVQAPVPPMDADGLQVVVIGTAGWLLATVALLLFRDALRGRGDEWWILVGLTGTGLGLCGVAYGLWRRHRRLRRSGRTPPAGR